MPPEMYHGLGLQMSQRQEMVMTPQMIQSMELLQLPLLELEQRIQTELMENPALELSDLKEDFEDESPSYETDESGESGEASYTGAGGGDAAADGSPSAAEGAGDAGDFGEAGGDASAADAADEFDVPSWTEEADIDWNDLYDEAAPRRVSDDDDEDRFDVIGNAVCRSESFPDHLLGQLVLQDIPPLTRELAEKVIGQLDEGGYLNVTLPDLAAQTANALAEEARQAGREPGPAPALEEWEDALFVVQSLHPAGTGARDLRECLLLQLYTNEDAAAPLARAIVENRLEDLAANRLPLIAKAERATIDEVKDAVRLIQSLDPKPGSTFCGEDALPVRPDVIFELVEADRREIARLQGEIEKRAQEYEQARRNAYDEKGEYRERMARARLHEAKVALDMLDQDGLMWEVTLPSGPVPEISDMFLALYDNSGRGEMVRQAYLRDPEKAQELKMMQAALKGSGENKVFRERFLAANDIVRAVRQREITIFRVAREIVARQKDYLSGRIPAPAPLMMKEVAQTLDIDIGTVSRAAREKYAETPIGLRPLREFFTRSVAPMPESGAQFGAGGRMVGGVERGFVPAGTGYAPAAPGQPASAYAGAYAGNTADDDEEDGGEGGVSNIQIRNRIQQMIDAEDKKKPLKDDQIQVMLEQEGIVIKRRTVAKHRLKLGYKNYSQRREY